MEMERGYQTLIEIIPEWIADERGDSQYYAQLATMAPTPEARAWFLEWSNDEASHAVLLTGLYTLLTGENNAPIMQIPNVMIPSYPQALRQRVIAESGDFRKYANAYEQTNDPRPRDVFFRLSNIEGFHAFRLLLLLTDVLFDPRMTAE